MGIHWKSKGGYQPDIFDIVDGKAYMHVPVTACVQCRANGDPSPNALYFVWDNGQWKRIRHEELPAPSEWNLLLQTNRGSPGADPQGHITIQDKTTGNWNDWTMRDEQKRFGWKRVNEAYDSRDACQKCGRNKPNFIPSEPAEVFVNDGSNTCHR